jgi:hypothetical protein
MPTYLDRLIHAGQALMTRLGATPNVSVADIRLKTPDETFLIGREWFPEFEALEGLGVHVQTDRVRVAHPDGNYVATALTALAEACLELRVYEAHIAFVDTVIPPPEFGPRYGFLGTFSMDHPTVIWVVANWTVPADLRRVVRHEAAHLAFARTHTREESTGPSGASEDFAVAFEKGNHLR